MVGCECFSSLFVVVMLLVDMIVVNVLSCWSFICLFDFSYVCSLCILVEVVCEF